ncbi:MAG: hypothetical protein EON59_17700 [Alphaproteobacteria bacterium]|nr:MAG: hypothetical protein EON59_17700 [Alphaproteobacteria bacterium]
MSKAVVMGDSHSLALADAPGREFDGLDCFPWFSLPAMGEDFFTRDGKSLRFARRFYTPRFQAIFGKRRFKGPWNDLRIGLVMGFATSRVIRDPSWMSYRPWSSPSRGTHKISSEAIKAIGVAQNRPIVDCFSAMRAIGAPIFAVSAPPLRRQEKAIRSNR